MVDDRWLIEFCLSDVHVRIPQGHWTNWVEKEHLHTQKKEDLWLPDDNFLVCSVFEQFSKKIVTFLPGLP